MYQESKNFLPNPSNPLNPPARPTPQLEHPISIQDQETPNSGAAADEGKASPEGGQNYPATNGGAAADEEQASPEGARKPAQPDGRNWQFYLTKWPFLVLGLYFAAAAAAMQALQPTDPLPISSQLVCSSLVLSLTAFIICIHSFPDHPFTSVVFICIGVFFGATALVVALVRNLHQALMWAIVAIYVSAIVGIIFVRVRKFVR